MMRFSTSMRDAALVGEGVGLRSSGIQRYTMRYQVGFSVFGPFRSSSAGSEKSKKGISKSVLPLRPS
jgi:hypothetical protein